MLTKLKDRLPPFVQASVRRMLALSRDIPRARKLRASVRVEQWESPVCALCKKSDFRSHFVFNGFRIVMCRNDGLLFVCPRPKDVLPFYDERYFTGQIPGLYANYGSHASLMMNEWIERLRHLEDFCGQGAKLVDVGAATGDFLSLSRSRGWRGTGVEASAWAAQRAREEKNLDVRSGTLTEAGFEQRQFDAVTMWDCIEHLSDPAETLAEAARILVDGGVIAISTGSIPDRDPCLSSGWYYPPWHLYYFSIETLTAMCAAASLNVVESTLTGKGTPYELMTVFAVLETRSDA